VIPVASSTSIEGTSTDARLNRYRLFDEVNAPYLRWQLDQVEPFAGTRVLEVGCGVGSILDQLGARDLVMGIDLETDLVEYASRRFANRPGFEFATLDISRLSGIDLARLKAHHFDTIVCINVLEHVEDDVAAIAAMADIVVPGGTVAVIVPAHPMLYGPYDRMEGHFRRYTMPRLRGLLTESGLTLTQVHRFNLLGALGWWVQYRLLRRTIHGQSHFKILQAVLPVMRAIEARIKPPFGLSLVAVAQRPLDSV
jgi:SAM-dependent methyltransferase